jgi:hypothetical protein
VFGGEGGGAGISTWGKEACIPALNPINEREQFKVFFFHQKRSARAIKWVRDTNEATLLTNSCDCLRWRQANLNGTLNEERNEISSSSSHFGPHQDGDPGDLRITRTLCSVNTIVIRDGKMRDPARGGGACQRDGVAQ